MLESLDSIFWYLALLGTGLFVIQSIFSLALGDFESGDGFDAAKFKFIWKQGLTGFLMMTGWIGLACLEEFQMNPLLSILIAISGGLLTLLGTVVLFKNARKLQSRGSLYNLDDLIGKDAYVYQTISKNSIGVITVSLNGMTHQIDAVTEQEKEIPSFTAVHIIKKLDDRILLVVPKN